MYLFLTNYCEYKFETNSVQLLSFLYLQKSSNMTINVF